MKYIVRECHATARTACTTCNTQHTQHATRNTCSIHTIQPHIDSRLPHSPHSPLFSLIHLNPLHPTLHKPHTLNLSTLTTSPLYHYIKYNIPLHTTHSQHHAIAKHSNKMKIDSVHNILVTGGVLLLFVPTFFVPAPLPVAREDLMSFVVLESSSSRLFLVLAVYANISSLQVALS
jgi:hypothetical protein